MKKFYSRVQQAWVLQAGRKQSNKMMAAEIFHSLVKYGKVRK